MLHEWVVPSGEVVEVIASYSVPAVLEYLHVADSSVVTISVFVPGVTLLPIGEMMVITGALV